MDTYPVAGNVLTPTLGDIDISLKEAGKLFFVPVFILGVGLSQSLPPVLYGSAAALLSISSIISLLFTPGSQSPFKYAVASIRYRFVNTEYRNIPIREKHADGMTRDKSLVWQEYQDKTDIIAAAQAGTLVDAEETEQ